LPRDLINIDHTSYSVRAAMGMVVVTAAKPGYETRQSRSDVTESTVLNFSLRPAGE
jgi:hypothetical protein